jgi:hypothetical protein
VQSPAFGSLPLPNPQSAAPASLREAAAGRAFPLDFLAFTSNLKHLTSNIAASAAFFLHRFF